MTFQKLGMLFAATLLGAALLVGCSSDSTSTTDVADDSTAVVDSTAADDTAAEDTADGAKSVSDMFDTVSAANPIANPRDLDDMSIELDFMLNPDDIVEYKGVASNDNGDAGMVIVIETAEGKAADIAQVLTDYAATQALYWSNYAEFADAKASVEGSLLEQDGNYIIMVFAANGADYTDIATAMTTALG